MRASKFCPLFVARNDEISMLQVIFVKDGAGKKGMGKGLKRYILHEEI